MRRYASDRLDLAGALTGDLSTALSGALSGVLGAGGTIGAAYVANADDYRFILVGNPYQPNGGILARFTSWMPGSCTTSIPRSVSCNQSRSGRRSTQPWKPCRKSCATRSCCARLKA